MSQQKFYPVNNDEFFSAYYPRLSVLLNTFARERHKTILASYKTSDLSQLVALACDIFSGGIHVAGNHSMDASRRDAREFMHFGSKLIDVLRQSENAGFVSVGDEIDKHLTYFRTNLSEDKFAELLEKYEDQLAISGVEKQGNAPKLVFECISNCVHVLASQLFNAYQWSCQDPRQVTSFYDTREVEASIAQSASKVLSASNQLEGWCSPQKSMLLYHLAREHKPQIVVEIGIYGGRSIVPMAAALKENSSGHVYGIETWSGAAATSYRTNIANDFWWMNIDFGSIKKNFLEFILKHNLHETIKIIEAPSDKCHAVFDRIDMLHIDGGHSAFGAAQDVINYVSKVPSGGIIVYDDINWPSTSAGLEILRDTCRLLHTVPAFGSTTEPGCAAFIKT